MNTTPRHKPGRLLLSSAAVLALAGSSLIALALSSETGQHPRSHPPLVSPPSTAGPPTGTGPTRSRASDTSPPSQRAGENAVPRRDSPSPSRTPTASSDRPAAKRAGGLPPPGSGAVGDPLVQQALDQALPADLPAAAAQHLVALARRVWTAEITGAGRGQWPGYFTRTGFTSPYTRVRFQAGIARRDGHRRAVVHLVWAGADPSGAFLEDRAATLHFISEGEGRSWTPVR